MTRWLDPCRYPPAPASKHPVARRRCARGAAQNEVEATIPIIKDVMESAPHPAVALNVPLQVDARAAGNWDEAH